MILIVFLINYCFFYYNVEVEKMTKKTEYEFCIHLHIGCFNNLLKAS